ncbi:SubName: Full=Uncharacterized protein {ECO:0000313/EMBL:CCA68702.1} [Serendipita indica DSM 11827]|uniref:Uncharacterized protein n=1 Tax=Serendipita indica (strain DSM 11827) TaxID=1109443 RepID=G4TBK3_SERID|nr:SubName: Full=Uncharacterized protein {ECO:0000313/EMBL:CCA68702.1} [Serendipita indica DSM 11827]CCA68702.1 hypothetical protein PIIN_02566 [Serendipita indica DSM 11827]
MGSLRHSVDVVSSPFDLDIAQRSRDFETEYLDMIRSKLSASLVCKTWKEYMAPFLWEVVCLWPGTRFHSIGRLLSRDKVGHYIRVLRLQGSQRWTVFDLANVQRILQYCSRLESFILPEPWHAPRVDNQLDAQLATTLREAHISMLDEAGIARVLENQNLAILYAHTQHAPPCSQAPDVLLPVLHTLSIRLSDMSSRKILAPSLQRWILHDLIDDVEYQHLFDYYSPLLRTFESYGYWSDYRVITSILEKMTNLVELVIQLNPNDLSAVPHQLPPQLKRLGFTLGDTGYPWVLRGDEATFVWFRDHLEDWMALAIANAHILLLIRFLDWDVIKLPPKKLPVRRKSYNRWWLTCLKSAAMKGIAVQNEKGQTLEIESDC